MAIGPTTESELAQALGSRDAAVVLINKITEAGTQGFQGGAGAQGGAGSQGAQGAVGATGAQGNQGSTGPQGTGGGAGAAGVQGAQGAAGAAGAQGAQGAAGSAGAQGAAGSAGAQGAQGAAGSQGAQGATGAQGNAGAQGAAGTTGAQGAQGVQGATGAQGAQGASPAGAQGSQGAVGAAGTGKDFHAWRAIGTTPLERWYMAGVVSNEGPTAVTITANQLYGVSFHEVRGGTIDKISINVTTAGGAGTSARLGIYSGTSDTNPFPNALVLDAGTVAVDATGVKTIAISQALTANTLYWFALVSDGGPVVRCLSFLGTDPLLGSSNALNVQIATHLREAFTFAALPATFPAVTGVQTANAPMIAVHYSA